MYVYNWTQDQLGTNSYFALACQKILFLGILRIRRMTFKFEYLSEYKLILENNLVLLVKKSRG